MRRRGVNRTVMVFVVVGLLIAAIGFMAMQPVIPMPDEANRIHHPAGYSIIAPEGWDHQLGFTNPASGIDTIWTLPKKTEGRGGELTAMKLSEAPTEGQLRDQHYVPESFDGHSVWVMRSEKEKTKDHLIVYTFERDGGWYRVIIRRPISEPLEAKPWPDYLRSFRVEKSAIKPSTVPSPTAFPG